MNVIGTREKFGALYQLMGRKKDISVDMARQGEVEVFCIVLYYPAYNATVLFLAKQQTFCNCIRPLLLVCLNYIPSVSTIQRYFSIQSYNGIPLFQKFHRKVGKNRV